MSGPIAVSEGPRFDESNPPDPKLIDACVHCGFCLTTCPSYRVIGKETDSPRGRIYQMDALNQGQISLSPATVSHFDSCLGCLACVTACPSGVQYDQLIAATRPQIERNYPRNVWDRLYRQFIFSVFPYPGRLRPLLWPLWLYQRLGASRWISKGLEKISPRLAAMESLMPPLETEQLLPKQYPERISAVGERRFRVGLILGCVQRLFTPQVNEASIRVLTRNGCEVVIPPHQGCCAALPHHQGQLQQAENLARHMIETFAPYELDAILINASGCGHTLKEYGHILSKDPDYKEKAARFAAQVRDIQEFLAQVGLTTPLHPLQPEPLVLAYQDACHMLHGQRLSQEPRQLLRQIPGLELRDPVDAALCCGSSGVYNLLQPKVAAELGSQKVENLLNTGAQGIVSANIGCRLQIQKHLDLQGRQGIPIVHPMELLDRAMQPQQQAFQPGS
ncbi:4Fe-4S dicluster domain-containing protein [Synechococcus sp. Nb3U1]|uniref:(Fe-S)-binding protein n=1 Tax=Synechococcus sp. Nb3U1 TaxID=1914529 RepID=UPI001F26934D|nr:heterodisulfide reductase-related iron-sulfur binding cluster [Synechococcus sp. Nb3U1]MCF2971494.1 4Fe-4S dicluster domain-containing protein [Synechococcus sp. Nb3U1]